MATITTHPATSARWQDVQAALTGGGDGKHCQCAWPVLTAAQWKATTVFQRTRMLEDEVSGQPSPGIVGYVDGAAAGWIRVSPRVRQRRILNSRIVKSGTQEPLEAEDVWAVTCFSIRKEYRHMGLGGALLNAAVAYASEHGARVIEGYPYDNRATTTSDASMYVGPLTTFVTAGFDVIAHPTPARALVSLKPER